MAATGAATRQHQRRRSSSEEQHHLAGGLGAALAHRLVERGWIERARNGRAVRLTDAGRRGLHERLDLEIAPA
jgi:hypothetical protein